MSQEHGDDLSISEMIARFRTRPACSPAERGRLLRKFWWQRAHNDESLISASISEDERQVQEIRDETNLILKGLITRQCEKNESDHILSSALSTNEVLACQNLDQVGLAMEKRSICNIRARGEAVSLETNNAAFSLPNSPSIKNDSAQCKEKPSRNELSNTKTYEDPEQQPEPRKSRKQSNSEIIVLNNQMMTYELDQFQDHLNILQEDIVSFRQLETRFIHEISLLYNDITKEFSILHD